MVQFIVGREGKGKTKHLLLFASRLGAEAGKMILDGQYGFMVGYKNREIVRVPLEEAAGKLKTMAPDAAIVKEAKLLGISFGD